MAFTESSLRKAPQGALNKRPRNLKIAEPVENRWLTQAVLANAANLSKPAISQIEASKQQPSVAVLQAIAKRPSVEMDDLASTIENG